MLFGGILIVFLLMFIMIIPLLVVYFIGLWKLFKKAGVDGWKSLIPFYNTFVLAEIAGIGWWYPAIIIGTSILSTSDSTLSVVFSLVSIGANFFIFYNLSKKFHQGVGFAVLITLFSFIMIPVLGFSKSFVYDKDVVVSPNGPIDENKNNSTNNNYNQNTNTYSNEMNNNTESKYCIHCGKEVKTGAKYCSNCGNEII